jgi:hypothetical protein
VTIRLTRTPLARPRSLTPAGVLAVALVLGACGEGPTETNEPRLCRTQLRDLATPAPTTGVRLLPVPVLPVSPVQDANCRSDSPIIRLPGDSTVGSPVPRPIPLPVPGGG